MTNKEIRGKMIIQTFSDGKPYYVESDIDAIQNLTRKSERERVIGEIEKWIESLKPKCPFCGSTNVILFTSDDDLCNDCNKTFDGIICAKNDLTEEMLKSKLNELRK